MRWIAAWTTVVLLVCTAISCTGLAAELAHARQTQAPPCHQHQKPSAPQASCDHQQAVTADSMGVPVPEVGLLPEALPEFHWMADVLTDATVLVESPPGPMVPSSVLRI